MSVEWVWGAQVRDLNNGDRIMVASETDGSVQLPAESAIEAEYLLEAPAHCPHCAGEVNAVQVVRMLRAKVNFVSSLPRRGQVLICPSCRTILGGGLGGLI